MTPNTQPTGEQIALKIVDWRYLSDGVRDSIVTAVKDFTSAQAAELAALTQQLQVLEPQLDYHKKQLAAALEELAEARDKLAKSDKQSEELASALMEISDLEGELNPNNYDHSDVEKCNAGLVFAINTAVTALISITTKDAAIAARQGGDAPD